MKYDGLPESPTGEKQVGRQCTVGAAYKQCRKEGHRAAKPLQKSLSHTSLFSSAPSSSPFSCSPSLSSPPLPSCAPVDGVLLSLSLSLSFRLSRGRKQQQSVRVCVRACVREAGAEREGLPDPLLKLYLSHKHTIPLTSSPHQGPRTHPWGVTPLPPRPVKRPPHGAMWTPVSCFTWDLISDCLLGRSSRHWIFWSKEGLRRSRLSQRKHFALGTVGCKPPWAGGQRSSTMDYLVGIFLLLCGVALPGRVAPQHTKESVPRLKLSYKGKFCNQSHHQCIQAFLPF